MVKGAIEGVTAPEAANNAAAQTAFVPMLSLGIPGDAIVAIMLGALIIHGVVPGPRLIVDNPEMFWGLTVSFLIGNIALVILNLPLIGIWVRILLLGLVLGPLMEQNLRRSLLIARGDPMVFLERPISAAFLRVALAIVVAVIWSSVRARRRA